jgi:hypothetical protein
LAFVEENVDPEFEIFLSHIPREIVLERPSLFAASASYGAFRGTPASRVDDALSVFTRLHADEAPAVRAAVTSRVALALSDAKGMTKR